MNRHLLIVTAIAVTAVASNFSSVENHVPLAAGCQELLSGDSELVISDIHLIASDTDSLGILLRADNSFPLVSADSVRLYRGNSACDSAAASYHTNRATTPDTFYYPVMLVKLHGTTKYVATAFLRRESFREYVLMDSTFAILAKFWLGP
jgi:hypothetical protein